MSADENFAETMRGSIAETLAGMPMYAPQDAADAVMATLAELAEIYVAEHENPDSACGHAIVAALKRENETLRQETEAARQTVRLAAERINQVIDRYGTPEERDENEG